MEINDILVGKLASIVVHADEMASATTSSFNAVAAIQLLLLCASPEVQQFLKEAGALAPVKR